MLLHLKRARKFLNKCFRQEKGGRKVGEVYLVAIICNPQAAAMTENFSQQVSGRAVSNMQCDLQPSPNGILDAFQIWIQVGI